MDGHSITFQAARLDPGGGAADGLFAQYRAQDVNNHQFLAPLVFRSKRPIMPDRSLSQPGTDA